MWDANQDEIQDQTILLLNAIEGHDLGSFQLLTSNPDVFWGQALDQLSQGNRAWARANLP